MLIDFVIILSYLNMASRTGVTTIPKGMRRFLKKLVDRGLSFEEFLKLRIADRAANRSKQPYTEDEIAAMVDNVDRI